MDIGRQLSRSRGTFLTKVPILFQKRAKVAQEHFAEQLPKALDDNLRRLLDPPCRRREHLAGLVQLRGRRRAALDPVLGHAARSAATTSSSTRSAGSAAGPALRLRDRRSTAARSPGRSTTRSCASSRPTGVTVDPKRRPVRDHRSARGPWAGHRRLQGRFAGRRRAARGPPGLLRHLLPRSGAGPDAARRLRGGADVRAQGARAPSGQREAGDRRQLPGRLGGDDARRRRSRRHRADRHQRRADVVLGRRVAGGRRRQSDALRGRHARRHVARVA